MSEQRPSPRVAARLGAVTAYARSHQPTRVRWKLDANEGVPPDPARFVIGAESLCRYPSVAEFEAELAESLRAPGAASPPEVIVTAGGDDALYRLCMSFLEPGSEAIVTMPSFEMIPRYARLAGVKDEDLHAVPWMQGPFPTREVVARITPATGAVFVVSPNNPTGSVAVAEDIAAISGALTRAGRNGGGVLVVDLAYTEFAGVDLTAAALALPNAVIVRTFSKAWGLAGLRVGCAAGPGSFVAPLRAAGNPYAASSLSVAIARQCWREGREDLRHAVERVRRERAELTRLLVKRGVEVLPSEANFVLARFADAAGVREALAGWPAGGFAVRTFASQNPHPLNGWTRITCPGEAACFDELTLALEHILRPPAPGPENEP